MDLVSVIIPVYNVAQYLAECINSVLNQTYTSIEILLIDDGSTDQSGSICDAFALRDSRVSVIHKVNGGVSSARNVGIDTARGKYLMFIDSDDYIDSRFIEMAVNQCTECNGDIVIGGMAAVRNGIVANRYSISKPLAKNIKDLTEHEYCELLENNYISSSCGKLISSAYLDDLRFDEQCTYGEDLQLVFKLLEKSGSIVAVPDVSYFYRKSDNSASRCFDDKKIRNLLETYFFLQDYAQRHDLPLLENFLQYRWVGECRFAQNMILNSSNPIYVQYRHLRSLRKPKQFREWTMRLGDSRTKKIAARPGWFLLRRGLRNMVTRLRMHL